MSNYSTESAVRETKPEIRVAAHQGEDAVNRRRRPVTRETKPSIMSTEFWMYLAAVAGVLFASFAVGSEDGHEDYFRADKAWLYVVVLTVGYLVARGLAKSGSADHAGDDSHR